MYDIEMYDHFLQVLAGNGITCVIFASVLFFVDHVIIMLLKSAIRGRVEF